MIFWKIGFLVLAAIAASDASIRKREDGSTSIVIPSKTCTASQSDPLEDATLINKFPEVSNIGQCFILCSFIATCNAVEYKNKVCDLYKIPPLDTENSSAGKRDLEIRSADDVTWYTDVDCRLSPVGALPPTSTRGPTFATRRPNDGRYFLPGHQCLGLRVKKDPKGGELLGNSPSIHLEREPPLPHFIEGLNTTTVEDCVQFCYLWGHCRAAVWYKDRSYCRVYRFKMDKVTKFYPNHTLETAHTILDDICCDEACNTTTTTTTPTTTTSTTTTEQITTTTAIFIPPPPPPQTHSGCVNCEYIYQTVDYDKYLKKTISIQFDADKDFLLCLISCYTDLRCESVAIYTTYDGRQCSPLYNSNTGHSSLAKRLEPVPNKHLWVVGSVKCGGDGRTSRFTPKTEYENTRLSVQTIPAGAQLIE